MDRASLELFLGQGLSLEEIGRSVGRHPSTVGYCASALHFHHLDPGTKRFTIRGGRTPALRALREEARKCVLVCGNCHAEVEAGMTSIPATVLRGQDLPRADDQSGVAQMNGPG